MYVCIYVCICIVTEMSGMYVCMYLCYKRYIPNFSDKTDIFVLLFFSGHLSMIFQSALIL